MKAGILRRYGIDRTTLAVTLAGALIGPAAINLVIDIARQVVSTCADARATNQFRTGKETV